MTKALLKKQFSELFSWLLMNKKSGKARSRAGAVLFGILFAALLIYLAVFFYFIAKQLCAPLVAVGYGWLYFTLVGLVAVVFGVFGCVFNTYASMYRAKDNDLLLSMPIPPSKILLSRLIGIYVVGLMYELVIMIPAVIAYLVYGGAGALGDLFAVICPLVLSFFVMVLSCVLGWLVAVVSRHVRHKTLVANLLSILLLAGYYYVYFKALSGIDEVIANPARMDSAKIALFLFYHMGRAYEGKALSMLIFTGIIAALSALVYIILSRSFIGLATSGGDTVRKEYREKAVRPRSVTGALYMRELRRFLGSSAYLLNCGLGLLLMPVMAIVLVVKASYIYSIAADYAAFLPVGCAAIVCLISATCLMSAPSVSLEGQSIWLIQSLPVSSWQTLRAKAMLHLSLALAPSVILSVAAGLVLRLGTVQIAIVTAFSAVFVWLTAYVGLWLNLKLPNLNWQSETVPVKQGASVMISLFGGWVAIAALCGVYYLLRNVMSGAVFLSVFGVLIIAICLLLHTWLKNRGSRIFDAL